MYIYDNVVILSSMWYVVRFEHPHGLKRYNDRRMTRGQTTCSLGGTASLGLLLPCFILTIFTAVFPKRLLLQWIVDLVKGIRFSLEELCESRCYFSVLGNQVNTYYGAM